VTNPFDDEAGLFLVLRNDAGQYSLWPDFCPVPAGWQVELDARGRQECLDHIAAHWRALDPVRPAAETTG
jgi:MbtH protein